MGWDSGSSIRKAAVISAVALLLLIPMTMLRGLVSERTVMREQAVETVARGWGGRQLIAAPILAIPVTTTGSDGTARTCDWYVMPHSADLDVELTVQKERRRLGVYEIPVYTARAHITGTFNLPAEIAALTSGDQSLTVQVERGRLLLPVGDPRGLRGIEPAGLQLASGPLEPWGGFPVPVLAAPLRSGTELARGATAFDLTLQIAGTESLWFLPLAHLSRVNIRGNWPDPGFTHGYLPGERSLLPDRFTAAWQVLDLNRSFGSRWLAGAVSANQLRDSAFGVDLVQPVDLYQRAERAVKYAELFIGLSFLTLFLCEHLLHRAVHPIQYALLGLALGTFFLLLLALAEQTGFLCAYVLAATALSLLLGCYLAGAFASRTAGAASGASFAAVYALLYLLVTSEDYALLAGTLGLFAMLAAAMVLTRKIDWYETAK
ncbi:MAG TPA: cell envelope integrity protein CreD [Steroidobacteraceae bacterium]|nr:cell envelope integrity protein CreD [Steroidobacteraceae bacterium]